MKHIIECIAKNNLHEALVRCWRLLEPNLPFFQEQEGAAFNQSDDSPYKKQKKRVYKALCAREPLLTWNLPHEYPLAFLEVLDDYLGTDLENVKDPLSLSNLSAGVPLDGKTYFIHRRVLQSSTKTTHASQTGHLQSWLRYHWIVPARIGKIKIRFRPSPDWIRRETELRLKNGELKVYVGSFPDGVEPLWLHDDPTKWSTRKLTDPQMRWSSVLRSLEEALAAGAAVVVLPELTICPGLRRMVSDWLDDRQGHPFILVLPGSFHEEEKGKAFNVAELFDRFGNPVLRHRKLTRFGTKKKQEGIKTGSRIDLLETPIGLIGIPICLDFCDEGKILHSLWETLGAEWLLVPAFGADTSIDAHLRRAQELFRKHGTVSIIANQHPKGSDENHGFVYHKAEKQPPPATRNRRTFTVKIKPLSSDK